MKCSAEPLSPRPFLVSRKIQKFENSLLLLLLLLFCCLVDILIVVLLPESFSFLASYQFQAQENEAGLKRFHPIYPIHHHRFHRRSQIARRTQTARVWHPLQGHTPPHYRYPPTWLPSK